MSSASTASESVLFKVSFEDGSTRRIRVPPTLAALKAAIGSQALAFEYTDDEDDRVNIVTDADLVEAHAVYSSMGKPAVRIAAKAVEEADSVSVPEPEVEVEPVSAPIVDVEPVSTSAPVPAPAAPAPVPVSEPVPAAAAAPAPVSEPEPEPEVETSPEQPVLSNDEPTVVPDPATISSVVDFVTRIKGHVPPVHRELVLSMMYQLRDATSADTRASLVTMICLTLAELELHAERAEFEALMQKASFMAPTVAAVSDAAPTPTPTPAAAPTPTPTPAAAPTPTPAPTPAAAPVDGAGAYVPPSFSAPSPPSAPAPLAEGKSTCDEETVYAVDTGLALHSEMAVIKTVTGALSAVLVHPITKHYFIMQGLVSEADGVTKYWMWSRWGRPGSSGNSALRGPFSVEGTAVDKFERLFASKTGANWQMRTVMPSEEGKFVYHDMPVYDADAKFGAAASSGACASASAALATAPTPSPTAPPLPPQTDEELAHMMATDLSIKAPRGRRNRRKRDRDLNRFLPTTTMPAPGTGAPTVIRPGRSITWARAPAVTATPTPASTAAYPPLNAAAEEAELRRAIAESERQAREAKARADREKEVMDLALAISASHVDPTSFDA